MRLLPKAPMLVWLLVFLAGFHAQASAQFATVQTRVANGDPAVPGTQIDVAVEVGSNTSGEIPVASAFRVFYNTSSLSFIGVSPGDLGPVTAGEETPASPNSYRNIATLGDGSNTDPTPLCFTMTFEVLENPDHPYSIIVEDDLKAGANLLASDFVTEIDHIFDDTATTNLASELSVANVATSILSGNPSIPGDDFTVRVQVKENPTGLTPAGASFRVSYNSDALAFVSAEAAQLGPVTIGNEEGASPDVFRDVGTLGNGANSDQTPIAFDLTFTVQSPSNPYSILVSDDPASSSNLLASDFVTETPHDFDNSETTGIVPVAEEAGITASVTQSPVTAGEEFDVLVEVSENATGLVPVACAFRINYNSDAVSFVDVSQEEVGPAQAGPEEGTLPAASRDISTLGDGSNTDNTPRLCLITFEVLPGWSSDIDLSLGEDPEAGATLLASDFTSAIPNTFDNSLVEGIPVDPPARVYDWNLLN